MKVKPLLNILNGRFYLFYKVTWNQKQCPEIFEIWGQVKEVHSYKMADNCYLVNSIHSYYYHYYYYYLSYMATLSGFLYLHNLGSPSFVYIIVVKRYIVVVDTQVKFAYHLVHSLPMSFEQE